MPVDAPHKSNASSASFESTTIHQDRLLPRIHGLRCMAAFAVLIFQFGHIVNIAIPPPFVFLSHCGDFLSHHSTEIHVTFSKYSYRSIFFKFK